MKLLEEVLLMTETPTQVKPLPTIWRVPDELWEIIEPILEKHDPPKSTGRPRIDRREALDAIIFRMRSGCQWNRLPKEFPDDSSVHRTFSVPPVAPNKHSASQKAVPPLPRTSATPCLVRTGNQGQLHSLDVHQDSAFSSFCAPRLPSTSPRPFTYK